MHGLKHHHKRFGLRLVIMLVDEQTVSMEPRIESVNETFEFVAASSWRSELKKPS